MLSTGTGAQIVTRESGDQVKQWEQVNPNKIDQVPVETDVVDRAIVLRMELEFG